MSVKGSFRRYFMNKILAVAILVVVVLCIGTVGAIIGPFVEQYIGLGYIVVCALFGWVCGRLFVKSNLGQKIIDTLIS